MKILIVGTGLIGASIGLALKSLEKSSLTVSGWDANAEELASALHLGAIDHALATRENVLATDADIVVLATPVLPILDWMERLAPSLPESVIVTDVGSTKREIAERANRLFNQPGRARFLPGHPMAGKESGGAALAEAALFRGAAWLFTPANATRTPLEQQWIAMVEQFGARVMDLNPERHDEVCAWVSHLPQMVATALSALLEDTFAGDADRRVAAEAIGGRALREMTRLGASPYSMWRDVAMTNTESIAATLRALSERLEHMRENLRTPELREEFRAANRFRAKP